jgi:CheY-like chemotaxis protein
VKNGARHHIKDLRVLVVVRRPATRRRCPGCWQEMGAEVKVAQSAAEAMTAVTEFHPQLLLCDVAMPGEDGYASSAG